jgi:glycosyltransferase involved in cell wall biosynthesis
MTKEQVGNVKVTWFPKYRSAARLSLILNSRLVTSYVTSLNVDIIHTFGPYGSLIPLLKKRTKKPVISSIHGVPYRVFKTFIHSPISTWSMGDFASNFLEFPASSSMMKTTLKSSDHIIFPSLNCLADTLATNRVPLKKISVIINGIDFTLPIYRKTQSSENDLTIVYCGRLTWVKGILLLIKAFSILSRACPEAKLKVIGGGSLNSNARSLVANLGLQGKISFLGVLPRDIALEHIQNSLFLVLPSLSENCPVVVGEAMSLGKPVVAFDFPFSRALITNMQTGLLANCTVEDFADKMLLLTENLELRHRLGRNAQLFANEKLDWAKNSARYIEIYRRYIEN